MVWTWITSLLLSRIKLYGCKKRTYGPWFASRENTSPDSPFLQTSSQRPSPWLHPRKTQDQTPFYIISQWQIYIMYMNWRNGNACTHKNSMYKYRDHNQRIGPLNPKTDDRTYTQYLLSISHQIILYNSSPIFIPVYPFHSFNTDRNYLLRFNTNIRTDTHSKYPN